MNESDRQKMIHDLVYLVRIYTNNPEKQRYYQRQLDAVKKVKPLTK